MDEAHKKVGFRDSFRDFAAAGTGKDFSNLTSIEIGYQLIKFYVSQIHNRISNYISEDDFDYSVTDGKDDLGADLIFKDDGMVVIIQSKYFKQSKGPALKDIQHFQSIFHRLRDPKFTKNSRLADRVAEIDFDKDTFALRYPRNRIRGISYLRDGSRRFTNSATISTGEGPLVYFQYPKLHRQHRDQ